MNFIIDAVSETADLFFKELLNGRNWTIKSQDFEVVNIAQGGTPPCEVQLATQLEDITSIFKEPENFKKELRDIISASIAKYIIRYHGHPSSLSCFIMEGMSSVTLNSDGRYFLSFKIGAIESKKESN